MNVFSQVKNYAHEAIDSEIDANQKQEAFNRLIEEASSSLLNSIIERNMGNILDVDYRLEDPYIGERGVSYWGNPYPGKTVGKMTDMESNPGMLQSTLIRQLMTPEGKRYYAGRGETPMKNRGLHVPSIAEMNAMTNALSTYHENPADSIPSSIVDVLLKSGVMR